MKRKMYVAGIALASCLLAASFGGSIVSAEEAPWAIDVLTEGMLVENTADTTIGKYIADEFGISFNYSTYSGDLLEKQALMLAGGDFNEIQYMQGQTMVQQYIEAGALLNLDDYKDLLPDFYERYADLIPYWRAAAKDGGLYKWEVATPRQLTVTYPHYDVLVRSDVLEYYDYPQLVSASDWTAFLEQALKDFPTTESGEATIGMTTPLAESWGMAGFPGIGFEKGSTYLYCGDDYFVFNTQTNEFEDYMLCPEVKESFAFFNDLYQKGILDEECFTDLSDQTHEKVASGRAIAAWYVTWEIAGANTALADAGHPEIQYIEMPFQLDSQVGGVRNAPVVDSYPYMSYGITTNCSDPERFCKFLNWCCTDEGQMIIQSGLEGVHYTYEDGVRTPTDLRKECSIDTKTAKAEGLSDSIFMFRCLPLCQVNAEDGQPYNLYDDQAYRDNYALTDEQKETIAGLGWTSSNGWWDENLNGINIGYTRSCAVDTTSDLGQTAAKMLETRTKYSGQLIITDDFEGTWAEVMDEYEKLDHAAVIDEMNNLYKSFTE